MLLLPADKFELSRPVVAELEAQFFQVFPSLPKDDRTLTTGSLIRLQKHRMVFSFLAYWVNQTTQFISVDELAVLWSRFMGHPDPLLLEGEEVERHAFFGGLFRHRYYTVGNELVLVDKRTFGTQLRYRCVHEDNPGVKPLTSVSIRRVSPKQLEDISDIQPLLEKPASRKVLIDLMIGDASRAYYVWRDAAKAVSVITPQPVVIWCSLPHLEALYDADHRRMATTLYAAESEEDEIFVRAIYGCKTHRLNWDNLDVSDIVHQIEGMNE